RHAATIASAARTNVRTLISALRRAVAQRWPPGRLGARRTTATGEALARSSVEDRELPRPIRERPGAAHRSQGGLVVAEPDDHPHGRIGVEREALTGTLRHFVLLVGHKLGLCALLRGGWRGFRRRTA